MKYFNDSDLFELFEFNYKGPKHCETLQMLLDKDGFQLQTHTPTLDRHLDFLNTKLPITGLSLNSNLYTKQEEKDSTEDLIDNDDVMKEIDKLSNSTDEDKASPLNFQHKSVSSATLQSTGKIK